MTREGSTCQASLRLSALSMASRGSTLSEIDLSKMVWQRGRIGRWRKVLSRCSMSLACLQPSGEKLWPLLFTLATNWPLQHSLRRPLMKLSIAASQISLCFVSGAVLLMCSSRGTSGHLGALDRTWRSVYSLDILRATRAGSSTTQSPRRWSFQRGLTLMNAFSCFRGIQCPTYLPLGPIPFLRRLQPPSHSQTSQRCSSTLTLTHRSQFMGEMGLLLLICLLFLPFCLPSLQFTPIHLHPCIIHFPLPLLHLQPLLLIVLLFLLLHLVLSASDVLEMSGCQNNGMFQIATSSPGSPRLLLPLQTKMRTLMIPLTSSRLVLLPQLNPHPTDSPSNALMPICGIPCEEEMEAHRLNGTWEIVKLPPSRCAIGSRWFMKVKHNADGSLDRYKSRLVAKGYSQRPGFDFKETFAPTVRYSTIHIVLTLAALEDLELRSVDISHAYLNGTLEEEIYMQQPEGFEVGGPDHVCRLRKSLYGLKQAGRVWNKTLHSVLCSMGFNCVQSDHGLYIYLRDDVRILMLVFADDITLACKDGAKIDSIVQELSKHFKLRDLGPTTQLLGLEIHRDRSNLRLSISQSQYISNLIDEHGLNDSKPVSTPLNPGTRLSTSMCPQNDAEASEMCQYPYISVVGCLMYLAVTTRPDIAYAAEFLARFNSNPGLAHWQAAKHVLRYLKGTMDYKLVYKPSTSPEPFITYSDADHGGNPDNGKSTGGYVVK